MTESIDKILREEGFSYASSSSVGPKRFENAVREMIEHGVRQQNALSGMSFVYVVGTNSGEDGRCSITKYTK